MWFACLCIASAHYSLRFVSAFTLSVQCSRAPLMWIRLWLSSVIRVCLFSVPCCCLFVCLFQVINRRRVIVRLVQQSCWWRCTTLRTRTTWRQLSKVRWDCVSACSAHCLAVAIELQRVQSITHKCSLTLFFGLGWVNFYLFALVTAVIHLKPFLLLNSHGHVQLEVFCWPCFQKFPY